jgi:hypothetical protein
VRAMDSARAPTNAATHLTRHPSLAESDAMAAG